MEFEVINNNKNLCLIFIHGIGCNSNQFRYQIDHFSKEYDIINVQLPGHGSNGQNNKGHDILELAIEIYNFIKNINNKFVIVAHSIGVRIQLQLYTLVENKTIGLILIDCTYNKINHLDPRESICNIYCSDYVNFVTKIYNERLEDCTQKVKKEVFKSLWNTNEDSFKYLYQSYLFYDYYSIEHVIKSIKVPILLLQTSFYKNGIKCDPIESDYINLFRSLDNVNLEVFENVSHWIMLQQPKKVNKNIIDFLNVL